MLFFNKKDKKTAKIDSNSVNELVKVSKKTVDLLFLFLIFILIFVIGRLLIDWGILEALKTLIKILLPLFIGFVIAWILDPIVKFLQKKGWNRTVSCFVVFFVFILIIILFFYLVIPTIGKQIQDAIGMVPSVVDNFNKWIDSIFKNLSNLYDYDFASVKDNIYAGITAYTNTITEGIPNFIIAFISRVLSGGVTFLLSLFIAFYLLFDFKNARKVLTLFLPRKIHNNFMELTSRLDLSLKNYVLGTLFVTVILFAFQSLGFLIAGLKAPLVFGLICAVTNIIPYVGPYIGGIPAVLVGYAISPWVGTFTLISVLVAQFLESYVLTPIILSKTMKLHPVTIIIGLLIFQHFFGIIGMLISTPVIACLKIIFQFFDEKYGIFKWIQGSE